MRIVQGIGLLGLACVCLVGRVEAQPAAIAPSLEVLRKVDREGKGHRAATQAWAQITASADADQLPTILTAMDGAGPLAANWLRAAVDAIAERQVQGKGMLPIANLEAFLNQKQHDQRARRLAYEWIARADSTAPDRLVPQFLDDPSLELRRDAVAKVLTAAEKSTSDGKSEEALATYRKALVSARDLDQLKVITEALQKLGQKVDLAHHFGFVQDWQLIGPFDNRQGKGFDVAYPPENGVDLAANYPGQNGEVRWSANHTDDEYGQVDLNKVIGKHMGAVAYATAEFNAPRNQAIELRMGSECAIKIWLNGKLLASSENYHANGTMDQYIGAGEIKQGKNVILLKICQNEQTEDWAQDWKFQMRVCDPTGGAVLATDRGGPRAPQDLPATKLSQE
jgi:hypothetical protein